MDNGRMMPRMVEVYSEKHKVGSQEYKNSDFYKGEWRDNKKNGNGKFLLTSRNNELQ